MKKFLSTLLICLLTLALPMAIAEADPAVGTWYLSTVVLDGEEMNAADIGYDMTIITRPDQSAEISRGTQEAITGTWKIDGANVTLEMSTTTWEMVLDGEALSLAQEGTTLVFRKDKPLPSDEAAALEVVSPDDFSGVWEVENVRIDGVVYPESEAKTNLTLTIESTNVLWKQMGGMDSMPSMEAMLATISGNCYTFTDSGDTDITCTLLEDGTMKMVRDDAASMIFYLARTEAE